MNTLDKLNLKKLINETECENNTESIRKLKHSSLIRQDIVKIQNLKKKHFRMKNTDPEKLDNLCKSECSFLFNNYTDIYHKVFREEIDLNIMGTLLDVLKKIEDAKVDQHEGSVMVGEILKKLYIDSALKRGNNIDKNNDKTQDKSLEQEPEVKHVEGKTISWKQFKQMNCKI
jgi:hypothetical protein